MRILWNVFCKRWFGINTFLWSGSWQRQQTFTNCQSGHIPKKLGSLVAAVLVLKEILPCKVENDMIQISMAICVVPQEVRVRESSLERVLTNLQGNRICYTTKLRRERGRQPSWRNEINADLKFKALEMWFNLWLLLCIHPFSKELTQ